MKKLLTVLALVTIGCFAFNNTLFSQTTICFDLKITDDCIGQWSGYYIARITVSYGGNEYCNTSIEDLSVGWNYDLSYNCNNLPYDEYYGDYQINVTVCRQELLPTCCGSRSSTTMYYSNLDDCDTPIEVLLQ